MKSRIKYMKLQNFLSFAGEATIGPLHQFTVIAGYNVLGKCDLLTAIEFVLGAFNPPALAADDSGGQQLDAWVEVIVENANLTCLPFKRRWLRDGDGGSSAEAVEFELNGQPVDPADYYRCLRSLDIRSSSAVLDADQLLSLFRGNPQQLLLRFEQFCGSDRLREASDQLAARMDALGGECKRHFEQLRAVRHKQLLVRRQTIEYDEMKQKLKTLKMMRNHFRLWQLSEQIKVSTADLHGATVELAEIEASLGSKKRESSQMELEHRRITQLVNDDQDGNDDDVDDSCGDAKAELDADMELMGQRMDWEQQQKILTFIDDQISCIDHPARAAEDAIAQLDSPAFALHLHNETADEFEQLSAQLSALTPDFRSAHQSDQAQAMRRTTRQCASVAAASAATFNRPNADTAPQLQLLPTWNEFLALRDAQHDAMLALLRPLGARYLWDDVATASALGDRDRLDTDAGMQRISLVMHDYLNGVFCESAAVAEDCQRLLQSVPISSHGINTLFVIEPESDGDHPLPVALPPGCTGRVSDLIRPADSCPAQLRALLASMGGSVLLADTQQQAEATARRHAVNCISADGVMFGARGDISWFARAEKQAVMGDDSSASASGAVEVDEERPQMDAEAEAEAAGYQAPAAESYEDGGVDVFARLMRDCRKMWEVMEMDATDSIRAGLERERAQQRAVLEPVEAKLRALQRKSERHTGLATISRLSQQLMIDADRITALNRRQTVATAAVAKCTAQHGELCANLHTLLLRLKRKNATIHLRSGSMGALDEDDVASIEAVQPDFACIRSLIAGPAEAAAASGDDLLAELQSTASAFDRIKERCSLLTTFGRLAEKRAEMDEQYALAKQEWSAARERVQSKLGERWASFRPYYEHMLSTLPGMYSRLYQSDEARVYLFPQHAAEAEEEEEVADRFEEGVRFDVIPPGATFRVKSALASGDQLLAALAVMFATFAFTGQPIVGLQQLDALLVCGSGAADSRLCELLAQFLAEQSAEVQVLMATDRPEIFQRADLDVGVVLMDDWTSKAVLFEDDYDRE